MGVCFSIYKIIIPDLETVQIHLKVLNFETDDLIESVDKYENF